MAKGTTIFYNNKKCNCKINCRAGNLNLNGAGATNMILNRIPPDDDIPTTDICDRHTITTRTALRNENNHIQHNNNDPEKTNYQQHRRQQQQQHSHKSHSHQNQQHRKNQHQQQQPQPHHNRHHRHPRRHHHYIVLQNHVIIIIILLLFIKILFVNCQQPTQIDQQQQQQKQLHQHQPHPQQHHHHHQPPSSSANDFRSSSSSSSSHSSEELTTSSVCSGSCSQDKATAKEIQLKSMTQHILARLKFVQPPNMTYVPHVPENIIADFMRSTQQHQRKQESKKYYRKSTYKVRKSGGYYSQQNRHQKRSHSVGVSDSDTPDLENEMKVRENDGYYDYQGDAPAADNGDDEEEFVEFDGDDFDDDDDDDDDDFDDDDEPFYSVVDKVYIIPTVTTINRKKKHNHSDILHFSFESLNTGPKKLSVRRAKLMFHVASAETNPHPKKNYVKFSVNLLDQPRQVSSAEKIWERSLNIAPLGNGEWHQIDLTDLAKDWHLNKENNHGITLEFKRDWMKNYVDVANGNNSIYMEVKTKPLGKKRRKRQDTLDCTDDSTTKDCCRYPLWVDFVALDWQWIIAPKGFSAYYCNGECRLGFNPNYPHSTISQQVGAQAKPCCSPSKLEAVDLLYFSQDLQILKTRIPNMSVQKCSCS